MKKFLIYMALCVSAIFIPSDGFASYMSNCQENLLTADSKQDLLLSCDPGKEIARSNPFIYHNYPYYMAPHHYYHPYSPFMYHYYYYPYRPYHFYYGW